MSKIKIDKVKLLDLSKEEKEKVVGGEQATITVTIVSVAVAVSIITDATYGVTCYSKCDCLTATPGHQDSCGLCTTSYKCPA